MTEASFRSSNQRIENERQLKKQKSKNHYKKSASHTIHHIHLDGPVAAADRGPNANSYASATVEDYVAHVRSDL